MQRRARPPPDRAVGDVTRSPQGGSDSSRAGGHARALTGSLPRSRERPPGVARRRPRSSLRPRDGTDRALTSAALRPRQDRRTPARCRASVRRHRRRPAQRTRGSVAVQRGEDRSAAVGWRPVRPRRASARRMACRGRRRRTIQQPAIWPLEQDYTGPDGQARTRRGFLARVRVEQYGDGQDPPARADPPRTKGGPPQADPGDESQPVPDLLAVLRPRRSRLGSACARSPPAVRGHRRPTTTGP